MTEANNNTETNKLDNLTVRRFARLLKNDGAKTGSPVTTGTVAQNGNSLVVYADGAMIPITQTSTGVNVGDEVTVIYGDDQAYIVGNNTDNNPTASDLMNAEIDAERAAAELIKQERAKIDAETDTVRQKAQDASDKADALEKDLDASNATITDLSTEVGTLGTRIDNAVETASETYATKTEVQQTATDIKTEVERDYTNDIGEKLKQYSTTEQTATYIQDTLSTNYYTKGEIEESYVSETQLTQKANEITTSVKEDIASEYATTKALSEVKQTADGVSQTLTKEYTKTGEDTNYTQQATFKTTVEGLEAKINSTDTDARKYATNYLSFSLNDGLLVGDMTDETLGANTQIISNGIRIRNGSTVLGSFFDSGVTVGQTDAGKRNVYIYDGGILIRVGTTILSQFNNTSIQLGPRDGKNIYFGGGDLSTIIFRQAETELAKIASDIITLGKADEGQVSISKDYFSFDDSSGVLAKFTPDDITLGKTDAGCNNTNITTDGINLRNGTDVLASFTSDKITMGKTNSTHTVINTSGMTVSDSKGSVAYFGESKIQLGKTSGNTVIIDTDGMAINNNQYSLASFTADSVRIGRITTGKNNAYIDSSGIQLRNGTDKLAEFTAIDATIGKTSGKNAYIGSTSIQLCDGYTALAEFATDGVTIGKTSSNNVIVDTSGLTINNGTTALASFTTDSATIGKTNGINATVDSDSFDVRSGKTSYISMGYSDKEGATLKTLNGKPLSISVAGQVTDSGSFTPATRSGVMSSWVYYEGTNTNWHITRYVMQADESYFYADMVYSGSSTASSTAISVNYPTRYKLKTTTPYHASVTARQTDTTSSYAGHVEANTSGVYFYPSNTTSTSSGTVNFTIHVCGYFEISTS